MTTTKARVICEVHDQRNPCNGCAGDHKAGDHPDGAHRDTCARCRRPRKPTAMPDYPALAANDTDYLEED